jgi:dihydrofolate reductase
MAFFREQTIGNSVIMGRKTFDSLGGKPLPKRNNIVLSHNATLIPPESSCRLALSVDETLYVTSKLDDDEVFVIGGAQTYNQFDELVDRYLVTVVDHQVPNADAFLSQQVLESMRNWKRREIGNYDAIEGQDEFAFSIFEVEAPNIDERQELRRSRVAAFHSKAKIIAKPKQARKSARVIPQEELAL